MGCGLPRGQLSTAPNAFPTSFHARGALDAMELDGESFERGHMASLALAKQDSEENEQVGWAV